MILLAVIISPGSALTDDQKKTQDSFDDGFYLGQLYIAGSYNTTQAEEYNNLAQARNDLINKTYGSEAKDYLLPILPRSDWGRFKLPVLEGGFSESSLFPAKQNLFVPDINAIQEIQLNKVIRPIGKGIHVGQLPEMAER